MLDWADVESGGGLFAGASANKLLTTTPILHESPPGNARIKTCTQLHHAGGADTGRQPLVQVA